MRNAGTMLIIAVQGATIGYLMTIAMMQHNRIARLEREVMQVRMELAISHFKDKLPKEDD